MADSFGARLRSRRISAGLSMGELAKRVNYSKSYLSKIENDLKPPTAQVARQCDHILGAGGELTALVPVAGQAAPEAGTDGELWVMSLAGNGDVGFRPVAADAEVGLDAVFTDGARAEADEVVVDGLWASFGRLRDLGQVTSPVVVLGAVIAHVHTLRTLAADNPEPVRTRLLLLASRVAEYTGWMSQEAGDERSALWWTKRAVRFAEAGRDHRLASYALVREAELALYRQDALATIGLAGRAQADAGAGPRILGLAARVEAQGHALAGDQDAFLRALDRSAELFAAAEPAATGQVLGSSNVDDEVSLARGWALCDLGRPAEAAAILDRQVARIPASARRARARFGARRALAHAFSGEVDQACSVAGQALTDARYVDSATVRVDLRQLTRTLARWRDHAGVRTLFPELTRALHRPH
jgi:transcriptional regulator with XRE-family HTH domain